MQKNKDKQLKFLMWVCIMIYPSLILFNAFLINRFHLTPPKSEYVIYGTTGIVSVIIFIIIIFINKKR
ncbi:hypothetical protein SAMN05444972_10788 [Marininema halotolerans]|uniref:Uncharacterized protein n=1 Tax=Marininema halotolerans TaxID=1155944 RepID=A0A1I6SH86_9BACL|nr:hypothetical protein SAMN05444972_10788 [Marininema halotolerans]